MFDITQNEIYPNPSSDKIHVKLTNETLINGYSVFIYNMLGKLVITQKINNSQMISVKDLAPGIYNLVVSSDNDSPAITSEKFIKE